MPYSPLCVSFIFTSSELCHYRHTVLTSFCIANITTKSLHFSLSLILKINTVMHIALQGKIPEYVSANDRTVVESIKVIEFLSSIIHELKMREPERGRMLFKFLPKLVRDGS